MIVFDLQCKNAHVFEAWFGSSADYDSQQATHRIGCPYCDNTEIEKAVMAPNVSAKGNQRVLKPTATLDNTDDVKLPLAPAPKVDPTAPVPFKQLMEMAAAFQAHVEASHEDVGDAFPEEVRKIHYGESDAKPIYGLATREEAAELHEEGIELMPMPFQRRRKRLDG